MYCKYPTAPHAFLHSNALYIFISNEEKNELNEGTFFLRLFLLPQARLITFQMGARRRFVSFETSTTFPTLILSILIFTTAKSATHPAIRNQALLALGGIFHLC